MKSLKEDTNVFRDILHPTNEGKIKMQEEEDLSDKELAQYEADIKLKNILMYGLSNEIYNSIDSNQTSKELCNALGRTQHGTDVGVQTQQTLTLWNYQSFKAKQEEYPLAFVACSPSPSPARQFPSSISYNKNNIRYNPHYDVTNFPLEESHSTSQELALILQNMTLLGAQIQKRNEVVIQGGIRLERTDNGKEIAIEDAKCYNCRSKLLRKKGQTLTIDENDFYVDTDDEGEQLEADVVFMERLEKMEAFEAGHPGVTEASRDDS
ncbi:hypothetical protein Tco_1161953 [Tanacetum coccineum]